MSTSIPSWPGVDEIAQRISLLRANMAEARLEALIITSQPNFEYFTGFRSLFWVSDARPMVGVVRRDKPGIDVLIHHLEERNTHYPHRTDVRLTFYEGFTEAALKAAAESLEGLPISSAVGLDYGPDMFGRGSVALIDGLRTAPNRFVVRDAADLIWRQRLVKSEHEIQAKRAACNVATGAFFAGLADLRPGISEYEFGQLLKQRMISRGADSVDWLPVRFGGGARSYSEPNTQRMLKADDFVWVDLGARRADQVSDLNRVAKVGRATAEQQELYQFVRDITLRLAAGIRPGMTGHDAYALFDALWSARALSNALVSAGRVGHGSGLALTEPPSLMAGSTETILEDMVLHVEPKLEAANCVFQVEEVFRVTANGPDFLSTLSPERLPVIEL